MANELELRIVSAFQQVGSDIKTALEERGDITSLNTTDKSSLVNALNEVITLISGSGNGDLLSTNNLSDVQDPSTALSNLNGLSASQITSDISDAIANITLSGIGGLTQAEVDARAQAAVNSIIDSAPGALDTLNEIAAALGDDPNFANTIASGLANRVRFDQAQTLTVVQRLQACENIGVGNPDRDFLSAYTTARDS